MPTAQQRGLRAPSGTTVKKRRRGDSPSAPPPLSAPKQYQGAAVLRRNTFSAYENARTQKPKGVSKRALDLLRNKPHELLKPQHHEELMHVILPGGVLEPRINHDQHLAANRKEVLSLSGGPEHKHFWDNVSHAVHTAARITRSVVDHPLRMDQQYSRQLGQEFNREASHGFLRWDHIHHEAHISSLIYRQSTGKQLSKKDRQDLVAAGFEGGPLPLKVPRDFTEAAIGVGPGLVYHAINSYHDPVGAQKQLLGAVGKSIGETVTHPIRVWNRPGGSMEVIGNALIPVFAGARVARSAEELQAANAARTAARRRRMPEGTISKEPLSPHIDTIRKMGKNQEGIADIVQDVPIAEGRVLRDPKGNVVGTSGWEDDAEAFHGGVLAGERGAGTELALNMAKEAKAAGKGVHFAATEDAVKFYRKLGLEPKHTDPWGTASYEVHGKELDSLIKRLEGPGRRDIAKAILRPPPPERSITYKGHTVYPAAYKSAAGSYMQRTGDYLMQKHLANPDNLVSKALVNTLGRKGGFMLPETRFGRHMRREARIKTEIRGGFATMLRSPKLGPTMPASLRNLFTKEDVSAIRKSAQDRHLTHAQQAEYETRAADIVAGSRGYTSYEMHHDMWKMGEALDWWKAHSHEFERGNMVALRPPPKLFDLNPNKFRTEADYARAFENMFATKKQVLANPSGYRYVPSELVDGLMPYKPGRGTTEKVATLLDRMTQGVRAGRFLHPGYAQWAVQNGVLHLSQAGMLLFRNAYKLRHEYSQVWDKNPEVAGMMEQASGAGVAQGTSSEVSRMIGEDPGAFRKIDQVLEKIRHKGERFWHNVDDRPWRLMSLIHELEAGGVHGPDEWVKIFHDAAVEDKPEAWRKLLPIVQRSRQEAIDYSEMTPAERATARRVFTAYGWTRGASTWTFRYPFQHPVQTRILGQLGQQGAEQRDEFYSKAGGMVPEWLKGTAPLSGGHSPLGFETELLNPGETPARFINASPGIGQGTETLFSDVAPAPALVEGLLRGETRYGQQLHGTERLTGPLGEFTRRFNPIGSLNQLSKGGGTSTVKGGPLTAVERYLGIPLAKIRDIEKTAALGEKDFEQSLTKPQQIDFRHDRALEKLPAQLQDLSMKKIHIPDRLIGQYKGDLDAVRQRDHFQLTYAKAHSHRSFRDLPAINKLEAALTYLHTYRHLSNDEVQQYRTAATLATDDKQLETIANALWASSGVGATVSAWKGILKSTKPATLSPAEKANK